MFVVCRLDKPMLNHDPNQAFTLTRGYWTEAEATDKAAELNAGVSGGDMTYYVLPARLADED